MFTSSDDVVVDLSNFPPVIVEIVNRVRSMPPLEPYSERIALSTSTDCSVIREPTFEIKSADDPLTETTLTEADSTPSAWEECPVCYDQHPNVKIKRCGHSLCKDCLSTLLRLFTTKLNSIVF